MHLSTAASQFLYGADVIESALTAERRQLYRLYVSQNPTASATRIARLAHSRGVTVIDDAENWQLNRMSNTRPHNGLILDASPPPQPPIAELGRVHRSGSSSQLVNFKMAWQSKEDAQINGKETRWAAPAFGGRWPFVLLLHGIVDPGNVGNLLRTARFLGVNAVGLTKRQSAEITPIVSKAAAGAADEITLFSVTSPVDFLKGSREAGWSAYAAVPPRQGGDGVAMLSTSAVADADPLLEDPCILVLGNEGDGLPEEVVQACDKGVTIWSSVKSHVSSLNVATAGGLLVEAFLRRCTDTAFESGIAIQEESSFGAESDAGAEAVAAEEEKDKMW